MNLIRELLSFKSDNKTFLTFSVSKREEINYSHVNTLTEDGRAYFLPFKSSKKSGADKLDFDLHGFVPLSDYIRREMDQERYFGIISDISGAVNFCLHSNLSLDNCIFEPKHMYYNSVQKKTYMLYIPTKNNQYICDSLSACLMKLHNNAGSVMITDGDYMNKYVSALSRFVDADRREGRNSSSPEMLSRFFDENGVFGSGKTEIEYAPEPETAEESEPAPKPQPVPEPVKEEVVEEPVIAEEAVEKEENSSGTINGYEVYLTNCLGNRYDIEHLPFYIGRGRSKDMVIDQPTVSGDHAMITEEDGHFYVRDLSTNGTYLNDQANRITYEEIHDGDKIYFDRFCYNFCLVKQEEAADDDVASRTVMVPRKNRNSKTTLGTKALAYLKQSTGETRIKILEYPFSTPELPGIKLYTEPLGNRVGIFIENVSCPALEFETMNVPTGYRAELFSGCSLVIDGENYIFTVEN